MSLWPFLKYIKPFRRRLAAAFLCMMLVGVFGAGSVLMVEPFLATLFSVSGEEAKSSVGSAIDAVGGFEFAKGLPGPLGDWAEAAGDAYERRRAAFDAWYAELAAANPMRILAFLCAVLFAMALVKAGSEFLANYHLAHALFHANLQMREDVFRSVLSQDYLFFTDHTPGRLISRINSDAESIGQFIGKMVSDGVQHPVTVLSTIVVLLFLSPKLTFVAFVALPLMGLLLCRFSRELRRNTRKQRRKTDELIGATGEALYNVRLVKAMGAEPTELEKFSKLRRKLFKYYMRQRMAKFAHGPSVELLGTMSLGGVLLVGGAMILRDGGLWGATMTGPAFMTFLLAASRFYRPMKGMANMLMRYQSARVSAERMLEMLALEPKVVEAPDAIPFEGLREGIELRGVSVRYGENDILKNVSIALPRGKIVAVVGRSGSGKTSLANLIPRLFDPSEGRVLLDGVDLRRYRLGDLRRRIGIVTQQTILFDDTVAGNIAYGGAMNGRAAESAEPSEEILSAARSANADEFIRALDGGLGYGTRVGPGGTKLSGGQGQRIAIARALYRRPDILIFDEATSALDSHAQAQVQSAINAVLHDRTALVISHRLSTVRGADVIYVLEDGRIVETGAHESLMAARGAYYALYQSEDAADES